MKNQVISYDWLGRVEDSYLRLKMRWICRKQGKHRSEYRDIDKMFNAVCGKYSHFWRKNN